MMVMPVVNIDSITIIPTYVLYSLLIIIVVKIILNLKDNSKRYINKRLEDIIHSVVCYLDSIQHNV